MRSFYTGNDVILGCARTNTLIQERQLRNVEISVCTSWMRAWL